MEGLDWGYCPELTFIKADPSYVKLEQDDSRLAACFVKFIQKAYRPRGMESGTKWRVPHVPDGAVFWYELLLNEKAAVAPVKAALKAAIGHKQVPNGGALDAALDQL